jgi:dCMP deaminase
MIDWVDIQLKMRGAYTLANRSPDTSTKLGAVYCEEGWNVAYGVNEFIEGFGDLPEHHERPLKYAVMEHAERNCLFAAAHKRTFPLTGVLVCNWVACPDCARAIVKSGLKEVICHHECQIRTPYRWQELVDTGLLILKRGGVKVTEWSGKVGGVTNLNNGEIWSP